jgi:hypothetical protein
LALELVITELTAEPWPMSKMTSVLTMPGVRLEMVPENWFLALLTCFVAMF